ncbi:hypothetical protein M9194_01640 [Vibrio sp. S4M6]|uniref:hypothetical protein n=1 Tax=Vibrio sinus TaxID=2946865 RepID=UPI00202A6B19|nr:hypothetical protein [Vibrio sinus]MCL9780131.1 hypothetical protein [Vibrio sinus]
MRCAHIVAVLMFITLGSHTTSSYGLETVYVMHPYEGKARFRYHVALIEQALDKVSDDNTYYVLKGIDTEASESLLLRLLEAERVDLVFRPVTKTMEHSFLPIRIPLDRGLLGWRIMLINKNKQAQFDQIKTIQQLQHLKLVQGQGWNDILVYEFNGIPVFQESQFSKMFSLVASGNVDAFPRGIQEVFDEHQQWSTSFPELAIEQSIVLHYDFVRYVWFMPTDKGRRLRDKVERGLEMMIEDGSFDDTFNQFFHDTVSKANLDERVIIELSNPFLPSSIPFKRKSLLIDPNQIEVKSSQ